MNIYDIGDQVRLSACFTDSGGAAIDPTVIAVHYSSPAGMLTIITYDGLNSLVRADIGEYYIDLVPSVAGIWSYRWESSGAATAAGEGVFEVRRSMFV